MIVRSFLRPTPASPSSFRERSEFDAARRRRSFVSKYEIGQRRLDLVELREICRAWNVPLVEFVKRFERGLEPPTVRKRRRR